MQPPKISPPVVIAGSLLTLWLVNYGLVQLGQAPWVYCAMLKLAPLFEGYKQIVNTIVIGWFAWTAYRRGVFGAIVAGLVLVVVIGFPAFMDVLWGLGAAKLCM